MRILGFEFRRILSDKLLWIFAAVSVLINFMLVFANAPDADRCIWLGENCGPVTEDSVAIFEKDCNSKLQNAQKRYTALYGGETDDIDVLYLRGCIGDENDYEVMILQMQMASHGRAVLDGNYHFALDTFAASRGSMFTFQVEDAHERIVEMNKNGETAQFSPFRFSNARETLYGMLLPAVVIETAIISVYIVLRSLEVEFAHGTASVVYCTRTGRRLNLIKTLSAVGVMTVLYAAISAASLTAYFILTRQGVSLSSYVAASVYPGQLPKSSMTELQYLAATIFVGYAVPVVMTLLSAAVGNYQSNSYFGLAVMGAVVGIMILFQRMCTGTMTLGNLILAGNPMALLLKFKDGKLLFRMGELFSYTPDCYSAPLFECAVAAAWLSAGMIILFFARRYFRRKDLW